MIIPHLSPSDYDKHDINKKFLHISTARDNLKSSRREINLPKAYLTKKGPLLLCPASSPVSQNYTNISLDNYSDNNWIDDLTSTSLQTSNILDNNMKQETSYIDSSFKLGKSTDYYIKNIKTFSGKSLNKAPYINYLPADYDYKLELKNILHQFNQERPKSRSFSRLTGTSLSFYEGEGITSDEEIDESNMRLLSGRPRLSAQDLISKLHCSDKLNLNSLQVPQEYHNLNNSTINYKKNFNFEDSSIQVVKESNSKRCMSEIAMVNEIKVLSHRNHSSLSKRRAMNSARINMIETPINGKLVKGRSLSASLKNPTPKAPILVELDIKNQSNTNLKQKTKKSARRRPKTIQKDEFYHVKNENCVKESNLDFSSENDKPIPISLTEIRSQPSGESIKVYKFFDRQSLKIRPMTINRERIKSSHSQSNKEPTTFPSPRSYAETISTTIDKSVVPNKENSALSETNTSPRIRSPKDEIETSEEIVVHASNNYLQPLVDNDQQRTKSAPVKKQYETRPRTPLNTLSSSSKRINSADHLQRKAPIENMIFVICDQDYSIQAKSLSIPFKLIEDLLNSDNPFGEIEALTLNNDFIIASYSVFHHLDRICAPNPLIKNKIVRLNPNDNLKNVYTKLKANIFLTAKNVSLETKKTNDRKSSSFLSKSVRSISSNTEDNLTEKPPPVPKLITTEPTNTEITKTTIEIAKLAQSQLEKSSQLLGNFNIIPEDIDGSIVADSIDENNPNLLAEEISSKPILHQILLEPQQSLNESFFTQSTNSFSECLTPDVNDVNYTLASENIENDQTLSSSPTKTPIEHHDETINKPEINVINIEKLSDIIEEDKQKDPCPNNSLRDDSSYYDINQNFEIKTKIIIKLNEELLNITSNLDPMPNETSIRNIEKEVAARDVVEHFGLAPIGGFVSSPERIESPHDLENLQEPESIKTNLEGLEQEKSIDNNHDHPDLSTYQENEVEENLMEVIKNEETQENVEQVRQLSVDSKLGLNINQIDAKIIQNTNQDEYKKYASNKNRQDKISTKKVDKKLDKKVKLNENIQIEKKPVPNEALLIKRGSILKPNTTEKYRNSVFDTLVSMNSDRKNPLDEFDAKGEEAVDLEKKEQLAKLTKQRQQNLEPRLPHMPFPYNSAEPVIDMEAYTAAFEMPAVLYPRIYKIEAEGISLEELILERRILEEKIIEIKDRKINKEKKKSLGSAKETLRKKLEDEMKEKTIIEERKRLNSQNSQRQLERLNLRRMYTENIETKSDEIEKLKQDLEEQTQNYENQIEDLAQQLHEAITNEEYTREALANSRVKMRKELEKKYEEQRQQLKLKQIERRDAKLFELEVKKKELKWVSQIYTDPNDLEKVFAQEREVEEEYENWMSDDVVVCEREEREIDELEENEDARLSTFEIEEEETALKPLQNECDALDEQKKAMETEFEKFKEKIQNRIISLEKEIESLEEQKKALEHLQIKELEEKKLALIELMDAEKKAKYQIQSELDHYRTSLLQKREKNLKLKTHLSFLIHETALSEPCAFSYMSNIPDHNKKTSGQDKKGFKAKSSKK